MELIFFKSDRLKGFENKGIHFSGMYKVDATNNVGYTKGFNLFSKEKNLTNLSLIIGENGSGKTTLLRLILQCLADYFEKDECGILGNYTMIWHRDSSLNKGNDKTEPIVLKSSDGKKDREDKRKEFGDMDPYLMYYSDTLSIGDVKCFDKIKNSRRCKYLTPIASMIGDGGNYAAKHITPYRDMWSYFYSETEREFAFLKKYKDELQWNITNVTINLIKYDIIISEINEIYKDEYKALGSIFESIRDMINRYPQVGVALHFIIGGALFECVPYDGRYVSGYNIEKIEENVKLCNNLFQNDEWQNYIEVGKRIRLGMKDGTGLSGGMSIGEYNENGWKIIKDTFGGEVDDGAKKCWDYILQNNHLKVDDDLSVTITFEEKNDFQSWLEFFDNLDKYAKDKVQYLAAFSWGMSNGESSMLSLMARIYDFKKQQGNRKSFLLLLDEPDLSLHPRWRREFLNRLIKFVGRVFDGSKVQIILTSHSPVMLSEVPKGNVVMMEDNYPDGNTFAANIYDLYHEVYACKSPLGVKGDYAEKWLWRIALNLQVIKWINEGMVIIRELKDEKKIDRFIEYELQQLMNKGARIRKLRNDNIKDIDLILNFEKKYRALKGVCKKKSVIKCLEQLENVFKSDYNYEKLKSELKQCQIVIMMIGDDIIREELENLYNEAKKCNIILRDMGV